VQNAVSRTVTVVLVSPDGALLGCLPPVEVATPWWQEVSSIAARGVQVLRLLHGDRPYPPGGHVTYLAEAVDHPERVTEPPEIDLRPHPLRAPYAEIGGPAASLASARDILGPGVTAHQQRTWNLSAIWRMDRPDGTPVAWLKQVPAFFAHEPEAIRLVRPPGPARRSRRLRPAGHPRARRPAPRQRPHRRRRPAHDPGLGRLHDRQSGV
jgi:hypothetical protein